MISSGGGVLSRDARNEAFVHRAAEPRFLRLQMESPDAVAAAKPEFDHPGSIIYFNVETLSKPLQTLSARAFSFEEQPAFVADMGTYNLWLAAFAIRKATCSALMSHVPKKSK